MHISFAALNVKLCVLKLSAFGSIGDRRFTWRTAAANGKSSITVTVDKSGGLGVPIVPHLHCTGENLRLVSWATLYLNFQW
jgi:hypothetical protein